MRESIEHEDRLQGMRIVIDRQLGCRCQRVLKRTDERIQMAEDKKFKDKESQSGRTTPQGH